MQSMNIPMNTVKWERTHTQWIHLIVAGSVFTPVAHVFSIFACLVLWLMKRDESHYIDDHGREALNFQLTMALYWTITGILCIILVGFALIPVLWLITLVAGIRGCLAAGRGETFRYPVCLRFVK